MESNTSARRGAAGSPDGGYIFPEFQPGFDSIMSVATVLELAAWQALEAAHALARKIADGPPIAIRLAKRAIYHSLECDLRQALETRLAALLDGTEHPGALARRSLEERPAPVKKDERPEGGGHVGRPREARRGVAEPVLDHLAPDHRGDGEQEREPEAVAEHRDAVPGPAEHLDVVRHVPERDDVLAVDAEPFRDVGQP